MCATFTDGDVEKRVENATAETIGVVTAIDDDVAHVEPQSGVMDSIKAAIGWSRADDETIPIRSTAVDEITEEAIRLETDTLDWDDETAVADETTAGGEEHDIDTEIPDSDRKDERLPADRSISATGERKARSTADEPVPDAGADEVAKTDDSPKKEQPDWTAEPSGAGEEGAIDEPTSSETDSPAASETETGSPAAGETEADSSATSGGESAVTATDADTAADRSEADETTQAAELDREATIDEATDDDGSESDDESPATAIADEIETGPDLGSIATDDRERAADDSPVRDPAVELNEGLDLEAVGESDEQGPTEDVATESMDLTETLDTGVGIEAAAEPNSERTAGGEAAADEALVSVDNARQSPGSPTGSQTSDDDEHATDLSSGTVGSNAQLPDIAAERNERVDEETTDREHQSQHSSSGPFDALLAAQRAALVGPKHLFRQGFAMQRAVSGATLGMLYGQQIAQQAGLETIRTTTQATRSAIPEPKESGMGGTPQNRDQTTSIESAVAELRTSHSRLLDAIERELDSGVDAVDEFADAHVDALAAGTTMLLATDGGHDEGPTATGAGTALEAHLDRTLTVYERLDEQLELGRSETTTPLPAQLEQLESHLR